MTLGNNVNTKKTKYTSLNTIHNIVSENSQLRDRPCLHDDMLSAMHVVFMIRGELHMNVRILVKTVGLNLSHIRSQSITKLIVLRVLQSLLKRCETQS